PGTGRGPVDPGRSAAAHAAPRCHQRWWQRRRPGRRWWPLEPPARPLARPMSLPSTIPFLGWSWDDLVFLVLAGGMLGSALLVVLGRDIIRSGLFMVVAFGALAG